VPLTDPTKINSVQQFYDRLRTVFKSTQEGSWARARLKKLKQTDSVLKYNVAFRRLLNKIPPGSMGPLDIIEEYKTGLSPQIQAMANYRFKCSNGSSSVEEFMAIAEEVEDIFIFSKGSSKHGKHAGFGAFGGGYYGSRTGHVGGSFGGHGGGVAGHSEPTPMELNAIAADQCKICLEHGHWKRECPNKERADVKERLAGMKHGGGRGSQGNGSGRGRGRKFR
jgi:Ty3 transposon capsid-like protein